MTRINNNRECTHEFFYCDVNKLDKYTFGTQCSFGKNFSDDENTILNFYSYYTKVAMLYNSPKDNQTYLLINWGSMTPTTGKHLSYLRQANPRYITINVPFIYGEHSTSLRTIINQLIKHIQAFYYDKECLYKKDNRDFFNEVKSAFNDIEYYIGLDSDDMQYMDILNELEEFINNDNFIQKKKELAAKKAAKTREQNKIKNELIKQKKDNLLKENTLYKLIKNTFTYNDLFDYELKSFIKNYILNANRYSYAWFSDDNETVRTSKGVTVNKNDVITLLKLWKHNKLKHGMTIDRYTVLEVLPEHVKIGCHTIPVQNINALWEEYQKELKTIKEVA